MFILLCFRKVSRVFKEGITGCFKGVLCGFQVCDIINWIGGIHSFVLNTKTVLYNIRGPRYKQIKMGYQISKCLNIGQSYCLEI